MALIEPICEPSERSAWAAVPADATAATPSDRPIGADRASAVAPYGGPHEHLADLLARHDWLLRRELVRGRLRKPSDVLGFAAITDDEVDLLLSPVDLRKDPAERASKLREIEQTVDSLAGYINRRVSQTPASKQRLPIIELAGRFALSALEIDIVVTCLAAEIDRRYERIYGYLQDDMSRKQPSPGLALALYCDRPAQQLAARAVLNPLAPLRHYRIVDITDDGGTSPWLSKPMRMDERIVSFLLGDQSTDARIAPYVTRLASDPESICPRNRQQAELDALVEQAVRRLSTAPVRQRPLVYVHGAGNAGTESMVRETARQLGLPVLAIEAELLSGPGPDFEQTIFLLFREGLLSQAALFLQNVDRALDQDSCGLRHRALFRCAAEMGSIVFLSGERPWHWPLPPEPVVLWPLQLRPAGFAEQLQAWRALTSAKIADVDLHRLMSLYPLPLGGIGAAWRMACGLADLGGGERSLTIEHLEQACRAQTGVPASGLARRIEPKHDWGDIVLPAAQREQLHAICGQAKHVSTVYGAWCFERKLSLGKGLSALFSGPPGTGKTMAAEVIAADLKAELLKIDLSQIVSKYIGETEKNLRQLFDQVAAAHAILFFDEADALLGKRSAVKDAHDRYANTEIAYLLQKMEEYEGIAILATNLRQNMDDAFTRRMRFIVEFPFPEDEDRLLIWKTVWPKEVPMAPDVDFPWLARQFRLSGGSIRNVALAAAFLAAEQDQAVAMRHLMLATKRELQKMGRLVSDQEYREHG
jgi:Winged helix domain, variant/ATPase family associated with various cellular activities (AAA)